MNSIYHKFTAFALLSILVLAPSVSFAKGNEKNKGKSSENRITVSADREDDRDDEDDNKKQKGKHKNKLNKEEKHLCLKAFGQLISKRNLTLEDYKDCFVPFGIKKKFGGNATTTDITAPVISLIAYQSATTSISVSWKTNENASSRIYFSTSTPLNLSASTTATILNSALTQNHLLTASGLTASTTYYFAVESVDASGNKATSSPFTLQTR